MSQHAGGGPQSQSGGARTGCVVLIGMRGVGKTSVGRPLAARLGVPFIDIDELIVAEADMSIADIFAAEGEAGFRRREAAAITHAVERAPAVISVGGGAVLDPTNVERLRSVGKVVWLTAPVDVLWARISADAATAASRPALTARHGREEIETLLATRTPLYGAAADVAVDTADRSPREVIERILEELTA